MLALWSGFEDAGFTARLREAGFTVEVKRVLANGTSTHRHVLWLARFTPPAP